MDLKDVQIGMEVLDPAGEMVGKVDEVKFGDPAAASDEGQVSSRDNLAASFARALGADEMHPQAAARLLRVGYIRVDCEGFLSGHAYAAVDDIASVAGGAVQLAVPSSQLHQG